MTDIEIYHLLKADCNKGFDALFAKYYKSLVIYSCGMTSQLDASEDIVQTVFYKYLRHKNFDRVDVYKLRSYLFTAVKNTTLNYLNSRKTTCSINDYQSEPAVVHEEKLYSDELIARIKQQISKLPPRTRQIVEDVMMQDMKYKEVAQKYSISVNTVKMLLGRGMKRLRNELGDEVWLLALIALSG